jgi:hypothetical protein
MKRHLNDGPQSIGNPPLEYAQAIRQWPPLRIQLGRYDQMFAGMCHSSVLVTSIATISHFKTQHL